MDEQEVLKTTYDHIPDQKEANATPSQVETQLGNSFGGV
jgi:hypothetical protein